MIETHELNITPGSRPVVSFHCSQYDAGRKFRALLKDNKTPYNLTGEETITITVSKPNGETKRAGVENTAANYLDITLNAEMTDTAGQAEGIIHIKDNNKRIGTSAFNIIIEPKP